MNLENIPLSEKTKNNLLKMGYRQLTAIQLKVILPVLAGKDIVAQSQTGTGKTAAFLIPVLEKLESNSRSQVLILVPTRELALQVSEEAKKLSLHKNLRILAIYGGDPYPRQLRLLRQGVEVIVGTPGRIIDHFERGNLKTESLKFLILDEVDEMINKGFLQNVEWIIKKIPTNRQTLLFSATTPTSVSSFAKRFCRNPEHIKAEGEGGGDSVSKIKHYYIEASSVQKNSILFDFLRVNETNSIIVFANTKRKVEQIKELLSRKNLKVDYIHSGLSQSRRIKVFDRFKKNQIPLLIATDVAARGLHVNNISYVVNYDFPQTYDFYIHRVGRTGRAGASGKAITFINSSKEKVQLFSIGRQREFKVEKFNNLTGLGM